MKYVKKFTSHTIYNQMPRCGGYSIRGVINV